MNAADKVMFEGTMEGDEFVLYVCGHRVVLARVPTGISMTAALADKIAGQWNYFGHALSPEGVADLQKEIDQA